MTSPSFHDLFSRQARTYARYRPRYPAAVYAYLASIAPARDLAWDCATGNGQAARGLARRFRLVAATDGSRQQLSQARPHPKIRYWVARSERSGLRTGSVDLVTVAQAVHWFDLDAFYAEVRRALRPGGVLAVWTYFLPIIDPEIDRIIEDFYFNTLGPYWSPRLKLIVDHYRSLPFPFEELDPPDIEMKIVWDLYHWAGFIDSWSGTQKFIEMRGYHPLHDIWDKFTAAWGPPETRRESCWKLHFRIGRTEG